MQVRLVSGMASFFIRTLFFVLYCSSLHAQSLLLSSKSQSFLNKRYILCRDDVALSVGKDLKLTAPQLFLDTTERSGRACGSSDVPVTMHYHSVRCEASEVTVATQSLCGSMKNAMITGCDHAQPHWSLHAGSAQFEDGWLTARHVSFRLGTVPVLYMPWLSVPVRANLSCDAVLPQISYDRDLGVGVDYRLRYRLFSGAQVGARALWFSRSGVAGNTTFEYSAGQDRNYSCDFWGAKWGDNMSWWWLNLKMVHQSKNSLIPTWVVRMPLGESLPRPKKIFKRHQSLDRYVSGVVASRWCSESLLLDCSIRTEQMSRLQLPAIGVRTVSSIIPFQESKIIYFPQVQMQRSWSIPFVPVSGTARVGGDIVVGHMNHSFYAPKVRLWSDGVAHTHMHVGSGRIDASAEPFFLNMAGSKVQYGVDSQVWYHSPSYQVAPFDLATSVGFVQKNGDPLRVSERIDEHQKCARGAYVQATASVRLRDNYIKVGQGYALTDLQNVEDDSLRRGVMPLSCEFVLGGDTLHLESAHQFDWRAQSSLFHDVSLLSRLGPFELSGRLAYYNPEMMVKKNKLFRGGAFVSCSLKCYHTRYLCWWISQKWMHESATYRRHILSHEAGLSYRGHCWNIEAGLQHEWQQQHQLPSKYAWFIRVQFNPVGSIGAKIKI